MSAPGFDWANDECVVLHKQPAIAVYPNNMGTIVIRQERDWDEDEDTIIVTASLEGAEAIAQAILREVEAVRGDFRQAQREPPKDATASERQRRRRNKQRDNGGTTHDQSTQETPTAELNGVLFGPEGPDIHPSDRDKDRDVTRDTGDVALFGKRDAGDPATKAAA
jgi:hypothetical protein